MNKNVSVLELLENVIMSERSELLLEGRSYLHGHTNEKNAYVIDDYPYGFHERTQKKMWIETHPKKGDRVVSMTLNPKNGRWNKPKASTYSEIAALYIDSNGHVEADGVSKYSGVEEIKDFVKRIGGEARLNKDQLTRYKHMIGETSTTGATWKHSFRKTHHDKKIILLTITFDVVNRIKQSQIDSAIDTIIKNNKKQMQELYDNDGVIQVAARGGAALMPQMRFKQYYSDYLTLAKPVKKRKKTELRKKT